MPESRPPGAPRKQATRYGQATRGVAGSAGPSSSTISGAAAGPSASIAGALGGLDTLARPSTLDGGARYDGNSTNLFNSNPSASGAVDAVDRVRAEPGRRAATEWLSRRTLPPSSEVDHVGHAETPTGRQTLGRTYVSRGDLAHGRSAESGSAYRTPSAAGRVAAQNSALYDQLTRGISASRRPSGHLNANAAARASLASSSGWGSPRMAVPLSGLPNGEGSGNGILQRISGGSSNASSRLSQTSGNAEHAPRIMPGTPYTPSVGETSQMQIPHPLPRFSFPNNSSVAGDGAINQDGSYSVIRDEEEANNSGLLALSPAVRRLNAFGITPIHARPSKSSDSSSSGAAASKARNDSGGRMANMTIIEHAVEIENSDQEEMESRRAKLLQTTTRFKPDEEHRALLELMRNWREDAMKHHLYDTAIFWGDKVLSLETTQLAWNDAYNLATAYFLTHRYAQAEHLLCTPLRLARQHDDAVKEQAGESNDEADCEHQSEESSSQTDWDELGTAIAATHATSRLPPAMLARAKSASAARRVVDDEDEEMDGAETTAGKKRKDRPFTVSGTGTASEGTSAAASVAGDAHSGTDHDGKEDAGQALSDKLNEAWREEQRLAMNEIRQADVLPPDSVSLVSVSVPCKYLAAQCMVRQGKYQEAMDELSGWNGDSIDVLEQSYRQPSKDGLIKLSSSIWHLKGLIYLHLRNIDEARESFMRSLSLDVKNFESFDQLVRGHLLGASQQWDFVEKLEYVAQAGEDPAQLEALQVVRLLYTARLDKHGKEQAHRTAAARRQLVGLYGLGQNPDVLLGLAEEMYARMRYEDAYAVTTRIMDLSKDHEAALPVHISCMFMIERMRPALYLLAHHLTDTDPDMAAAWYAVGCWYFSTRRWLEARKHFSKCVQLDPRFTPGWIAFAHTFAHEGESDQAIISYSTAERSFSANFLVKLFLGMEHLAQGNLTLAELYLGGSAEVWEEDALSRNERGVVAYYAGRSEEAIDLFRSALQASNDVQQPPSAWTATHVNLAFALRRCGQLDEARASFLRALDLDPDLGSAYTGVAMCFHGQGNLDEAVVWYHRALAVDALDKHANELLAYALHESAQRMPDDLLSAADRAIEQQRQTGAQAEQGAALAKGGQALGIRLAEEESRERSMNDGEEDVTKEMSLADGSASVDMDESDY